MTGGTVCTPGGRIRELKLSWFGIGGGGSGAGAAAAEAGRLVPRGTGGGTALCCKLI